MAVFFISQQILTNIAQINAKAKDNNLREFVRIWLRRAKGCLTHFRGLTEPLLWIGLRRAEGSTSCRRLAIATANVRSCDDEGSPCKR